MGVKATVKRAIRTRTGWDLQPYRWHPRRLGAKFEPKTVFDVGVAEGTPELYAAFPDARFLLIDPLEERLTRGRPHNLPRNAEFIRVALGAKPGVAALRVEVGDASKSSLLHRTDLTRTGLPIQEREVQIETLDRIVAERQLCRPFAIKVDVEGFELEVLNGARATLAACTFLIVELSVARRFRGAPSALETMNWLDDHGFQLDDILGASWSNSRLAHIDGLFVPPRQE